MLFVGNINLTNMTELGDLTLAHSSMLSMLCCSDKQSKSVFTILYSLVLSANSIGPNAIIHLHRKVINVNGESTGPRTLPCGTPLDRPILLLIPIDNVAVYSEDTCEVPYQKLC